MSISERLPAPFGRYLLVRRIAVGGMAEIFLAKQQGPGRFERSVVIKRILPHLVEDQRFVDMFKDEAALAAQLNHPNIAQILDFGFEAEHYYIALELVRGPDVGRILEACVKRGAPPPVPVSVRIIADVLGALDYAHRATDEAGAPLRIVHRDVTPSNIMLTAEGTTKLLDFGIAKAANASHFTDAGLIKGKFRYMAPEQVAAKPLDGRTDLYAAALVLYELLTLTPGLRGEGASAITEAIAANVTPIAEVRADLPRKLRDALATALQRLAENRFPSCREFQAALEEILAELPGRPHTRAVVEFVQELEAEAGGSLSRIGSVSGTSSKSGGALEVTVRGQGPQAEIKTTIEQAPDTLPPSQPPKTTVDQVASPEGQTVLKPLRAPPLSGLASQLPEEEVTHPTHDALPAPRARSSLALPIALLVAMIAMVAFAGKAYLWGATAKSATTPIADEPPIRPIEAPPLPPLPEKPPTPVTTPPPVPPIEVAQPAATPSPQPAPTVAPPPITAGVASPKHHRTERVAHSAGPAQPGPTSTEPAAPGSLILAINPWANVTLDERDLGQTPMPPARLSPGKHHVVLVNPTLGRTVDRTVTIESGKTTMLKVNLQQP